jgi:hypothetical protein
MGGGRIWFQMKPRTTALALRVVAYLDAHCGQAEDEQGACFQVQLPAAPRSNNASQAS